jgi:hypothetical protein
MIAVGNLVPRLFVLTLVLRQTVVTLLFLNTFSTNRLTSCVFSCIAEPDGPPLDKKVNYVDESTISFSWSPPLWDLRNGIILHYNVCIREYGPDFSCARPKMIESDSRSSSYAGLKPSSEYVVVIKAATIVGLGPPAFIQKTAGKY